MNKLWILVKNNFKMIFRKKAMLVVIVLSALLVIAALANAFHTLLDRHEDAGRFKLGYSMSENSLYSQMEKLLTDGFKEQGIETEKYSDKTAEELIKSGQVDVFVEFGDADYRIYGNEKKEIQSRVVQYVLFRTDVDMEAMMTGENGKITLKSEELKTIKTAEAENYYGLIEIIYFASLSSLILCFIFQTERKSNIGIRFRVGKAGAATRYFGKLIACVITSVLFQIIIETLLVTSVFDVKLGKPHVSLLLMVLEVIAFASFGLLFFIMFDNMAVSIGLLFMTNWFLGFIGGSFETYMYSSLPHKVRNFSPLYYLNRAIVELSANGSSEYVIPCVICMLSMTAVCVPLGILLTAKKREV